MFDGKRESGGINHSVTMETSIQAWIQEHTQALIVQPR